MHIHLHGGSGGIAVCTNLSEAIGGGSRAILALKKKLRVVSRRRLNIMGEVVLAMTGWSTT